MGLFKSNSNETKKYKIIIAILLLIIICLILFFALKYKILNEKLDRMSKRRLSRSSSETIEIKNKEPQLPNPDRIVYKNSNNEYIVIKSNSNYYDDIYYELDSRVSSNTIEGKTYSEDEITKMQNEGKFVEFDYDKKSKNYVFMLDEDEIGIIRRSSNGGQVIQTSLFDTDDLIEEIDDLTENITTKYNFENDESYISENKMSQITSDLGFTKTLNSGVYKKVIESDENEYKEILKKLNFKNEKGYPEVDFNNKSVVILASIYEINDIKKNIGNIKFELGEFSEQYNIALFIVSKVVNVNCIYFNLSETTLNIDEFFEGNDMNGSLNYYVKDKKYYTYLNNEKKEIISINEAADIADEEAKKKIYQYQEDWESDFYSRENDNESAYGELIYGEDEITMKVHNWNPKWQINDYQGKIMWVVNLFDRNDPLTNLYIFVDAINGDVIGAGASSD